MSRKNYFLLYLFLLVTTCYYSYGQDSLFVSANYPTQSLLTDIESFAGLSKSDIEKLSTIPAGIGLTINYLGKVIEVSVQHPDSNIVSRITSACFKLYDFIPATYQGVAIDSYYFFHMTYAKQDYRSMRILPEQVRSYKSTGKAIYLEVGGQSGVTAGNISNYRGLFGGIQMNFGYKHKNHLYGMSLIASGSDRKKSFLLPMNVLNSKNNTIGGFVFFMGRTLHEKSNTLNAYLSFNILLIHAGRFSDEKLFSFNGFGPGIEMEYNINLKKPKVNYYAYDLVEYKHELGLFAGWKEIMNSGIQSNGRLFYLGVKYRFSIGSIKDIELK